MDDQRAGKEPLFWERMFDTKTLALAPPIGLALAYLYEAGRYTYMDVPWLLIELPIPRLIASATCLSVVAVVILTCFFATSHGIEAKSKFRRYLGWSAAFFAIFGLGALLNATSIKAVVFCVFFSMLLPMLVGGDDSKSVEAGKSAERKAFGSIVGGAVLLGFMAYTVHGVGFTAERLMLRRDCFSGIDHAFVAGISTGQLVVKQYDPASRRTVPGVTLVPMDERLKLTRCIVPIKTWNVVPLIEKREVS